MDEEERRRLAVARCFLGSSTWPVAVPPTSTAEPIRVTAGQPIVVPAGMRVEPANGHWDVIHPDGHVIVSCATKQEAHDFVEHPLELGYGGRYR